MIQQNTKLWEKNRFTTLIPEVSSTSCMLTMCNCTSPPESAIISDSSIAAVPQAGIFRFASAGFLPWANSTYPVSVHWSSCSSSYSSETKNEKLIRIPLYQQRSPSPAASPVLPPLLKTTHSPPRSAQSTPQKSI